MRIMFVLKVQSAINPFKRTLIGKYLKMTWVRYHPDEERSIFKLVDIWFHKLLNIFKSKQPEINLADPQKRLEDTLVEMNKQTTEQIRSIKHLFNYQVNRLSFYLYIVLEIKNILKEFSKGEIV